MYRLTDVIHCGETCQVLSFTNTLLPHLPRLLAIQNGVDQLFRRLERIGGTLLAGHDRLNFLLHDGIGFEPVDADGRANPTTFAQPGDDLRHQRVSVRQRGDVFLSGSRSTPFCTYSTWISSVLKNSTNWKGPSFSADCWAINIKPMLAQLEFLPSSVNLSMGMVSSSRSGASVRQAALM